MGTVNLSKAKPAVASLGQSDVKSQQLHPCLLRGSQRPTQLGAVLPSFQAHQQGAGLEVEQLKLQWVLWCTLLGPEVLCHSASPADRFKRQHIFAA